MQIIDGVVVIYNPSEEVLFHVSSYAHSLRTLYVIDNSTQLQKNVIDKLQLLENVVYVNCRDNMGIAYALNKGAELAIANGADWLLTMDQDSRFCEGAVQRLFEYADVAELQNNAGIISAQHKVKGLVLSQSEPSDDLLQLKTVMTSGNLVNLNIYRKVGPFYTPYFIDCVDHEYCLRLRKHGFYVCVCWSSLLEHALGDINSFSIFGRTLYYTNHSAVRRYYMTRNRLDMCVRYLFLEPRFVLNEMSKMISEGVKILLFEKNKFDKSSAMIKGLYHFFIRKFGKI